MAYSTLIFQRQGAALVNAIAFNAVMFCCSSSDVLLQQPLLKDTATLPCLWQHIRPNKKAKLPFQSDAAPFNPECSFV